MRRIGAGRTRGEQRRVEARISKMPDVLDSPIPADDDVLRRDTHVEGARQGRIAIEHNRHADAKLLLIFANRLDGIVEADIYRDYRKIRPRSLIGMLKMRHLLAARHAPGRPKLEVHGFLAVQAAKIDGIAVDCLDHQVRRRSTQEIVPGRFRPLLPGNLRAGG